MYLTRFMPRTYLNRKCHDEAEKSNIRISRNDITIGRFDLVKVESMSNTAQFQICVVIQEANANYYEEKT